MEYKLIQEYPGSPEVGVIVKFNGVEYKNDFWIIDSVTVEEYPEYWEKIDFFKDYNSNSFHINEVLFCVDTVSWSILQYSHCNIPQKITIFFKYEKDAIAFKKENEPVYSRKDMETILDEVPQLIKDKILKNF